jgi:hypothetical protein
MDAVSLTAQLTPADYAIAQRFIADALRRRGRWYWPVRLLGVMIGVLLALGFIGLFTLRAPLEPQVVTQVRLSALALLGAILVAVAAGLLHKRSVAAVLFPPGGKLLSPFTLTFGEASLTLATSTGRAEFPWASVDKVELSGRHLYIFTLPHQAIIVPRSAFPSHDEFVTLAAQLNQRVSQHAA